MAKKRDEVSIPRTTAERERLIDKYMTQWKDALHAINKEFIDKDIVRRQLARCVDGGALPDFPKKPKLFLSELLPNKPEVQLGIDAAQAAKMEAVRGARKKKVEESMKPQKPKKRN
jgi:hypothetical protein